MSIAVKAVVATAMAVVFSFLAPKRDEQWGLVTILPAARSVLLGAAADGGRAIGVFKN